MEAILALAFVVCVVHAQDPDVLFAQLTNLDANLGAAERLYSQGPADDFSKKDEFDFIVVGAGAGGCVVANRLTEISNWTVLLLEAGGDETFAMDIPYTSGPSPYIDWGYTLVKQTFGGCMLGPEGRCPYPRGKVMGGSTTVNYCAYSRGNRRDYDLWASLGMDGWDYDSVLLYFKKLENMQIPELRDSPYHGTEGNIMVSYATDSPLTPDSLEAARLLDIPIVDFNGANQTGISRVPTTTYKGTRWSANRGYILGLQRCNLFVRKNALVSKVLIENGRAVGVKYSRNGTEYTAYAKKEVILSAGAINSPQLLILSGVGPKDHLEELDIPEVVDLPVGRTLYDHTAFMGLVIKLNTSVVPTTFETLRNISNFAQYITDHTGPLSAVAEEAMRFFEIGDEAVNNSWPNMESYLFGQFASINPSGLLALGFTDEFVQDFYGPLQKESAFTVAIVNNRPKSCGTVTLQNKNISSQPNIDPKFFSAEEDVTTLVEAIKDSIRLFTSGPFASLGAAVYDTPVPGCTEFTFNTDEYWCCAVRKASINEYHPSSTCRAGRSTDPLAVVDPNLKVWGVEGLRVIDASVMPYTISGHLQAPVYMIAEKGADMIKCEHLEGVNCTQRGN